MPPLDFRLRGPRPRIAATQLPPGSAWLSSTLHAPIATWIIFIAWALFAAGVYLPDVGRGFIKDDFQWILDGTAALQHPLRSFWSGWDGNFFRPLVALSFGADHALYGLWARGYGLTNLALYAACVPLLFALLRHLGFSRVSSAGGTFAWAVNPSGLDMAVLWLSGRTSLLMTLFSCGAILAALRRRRLMACVLFACALFSKEDALPIPITIAAIAIAQRRSRGEWCRDLAALSLVAVGYLALRFHTHAISAATAPDFYRLTWRPGVLLDNLLHYIDRAGTSTAVLLLLVCLAARRTIAWRSLDRRIVVVALVWFAAGICITVRVPVRSSLYVVFPSIAAAMLFAAAMQTMRERATGARVDGYLAGVCASVLLLLPAYNVRNDRWVESARVSTRALAALQQAPEVAQARYIVFRDESSRFSNLRSGLAGVATPALRLMTGRTITGTVIPPGTPDPPAADLVVELEAGAVTVRPTKRD